MKKAKSYLPFISIFLGISVFVWLVFSLIVVLARSLDLGYSKLIVLNIIPAVISSLALILAFSAASPIVNDFLVTLRRLLRIDNLSNPLLLKLSLQAPGTYHHSINVSNLAQKAAKVIGADSLLVRIAAYYHDIGKLENPDIFIENQTISSNQSLGDNPKASAKQIIAHVASGVKLAKSNNLTDEICDLIAQHHGTTLTNFFFEVAKNNDHKSEREDFRYPGPKPSSRESGVLMLSDCTEAAVRSLENVHLNDIESTVRKIIKDRSIEGQLENSGLSQRDLAKIEGSLIETMKVIYHRRIVK